MQPAMPLVVANLVFGAVLARTKLRLGKPKRDSPLPVAQARAAPADGSKASSGAKTKADTQPQRPTAEKMKGGRSGRKYKKKT